MSDETEREWQAVEVTIKYAGDSAKEKVKVPVVKKLRFNGTNAYVYNQRFRNESDNESRDVHTKDVKAHDKTDAHVLVERIEIFRDLATNAQLIKFKEFNFDPAPKQINGDDDPHHLEKHYVRFYKDNDKNSSFWVDMELIDRADFIHTNGQLMKWKFRWPTTDDMQLTNDDDPFHPYIGFCDPELEIVETEVGLPARFDGWQNLVNCHAKEPQVGERFGVINISLAGYSQAGGGGCNTACYVSVPDYYPMLYPCGYFPNPWNQQYTTEARYNKITQSPTGGISEELITVPLGKKHTNTQIAEVEKTGVSGFTLQLYLNDSGDEFCIRWLEFGSGQVLAYEVLEPVLIDTESASLPEIFTESGTMSDPPHTAHLRPYTVDFEAYSSEVNTNGANQGDIVVHYRQKKGTFKWLGP